jgi:hypothetical protein
MLMSQARACDTHFCVCGGIRGATPAYFSN